MVAIGFMPINIAENLKELTMQDSTKEHIEKHLETSQQLPSKAIKIEIKLDTKTKINQEEKCDLEEEEDYFLDEGEVVMMKMKTLAISEMK